MLLAPGMVLALATAARLAAAQPIVLTPVSFPNAPIGIDHYVPTNQVVISYNYPLGVPGNFALINPDGSLAAYSAAAGYLDEVKIATARNALGGFVPGDLFGSNGVAGGTLGLGTELVRVSPGGAPVANPWVILPGEPGLIRGGLHVDRTGLYGGDLIVVSTAGNIWRVNSLGVPTLLASLPGVHLEGVITVPNNPGLYGPWAGQILVGAEGLAGFYTCDALGNTAFYQAFDVNGNAVAPEDIEIVPPCENFYGANYSTQIMGAHSSQFASMVGDIVAAQEFPGILWRVQWTGAGFLATQLAAVSQWEHITFSPAPIGPIPPGDNIPPTVICSLAITRLWPPNHNLVNVGLRIAVKDNCDPNPTVSVAVYADEDDEEATGDGRHSPDAKDIAAGTLRLRSERKGDADGRVYLIVVTAKDATGNVSVDCCTVVVPHSMSAAAIASVLAQAAAAEAYCEANGGAAPPGFVVVGDGPILGPKQ
jgi:hypothetical protein